MAEIIRSWQCENSRCRKTFDSWDANPECPACRCVRVSWVPGGGHIAGTAKAADAELRALADCFRMTDIASARRDEPAKRVAEAPASNGPLMQFAPGFAAPTPSTNQAACVPTAAGVCFKDRVGDG